MKPWASPPRPRNSRPTATPPAPRKSVPQSPTPCPRSRSCPALQADQDLRWQARHRAGRVVTCGLAKGGTRQSPRRVEGRQRRIGLRDEQGDLGAAENHRIATPLTQRVDDLSKHLSGTVLEATANQFVEDDLVDRLAV